MAPASSAGAPGNGMTNELCQARRCRSFLRKKPPCTNCSAVMPRSCTSERHAFVRTVLQSGREVVGPAWPPRPVDVGIAGVGRRRTLSGASVWVCDEPWEPLASGAAAAHQSGPLGERPLPYPVQQVVLLHAQSLRARDVGARRKLPTAHRGVVVERPVEIAVGQRPAGGRRELGAVELIGIVLRAGDPGSARRSRRRASARSRRRRRCRPGSARRRWCG